MRMSWVENFLKINKRGGTSIRDLRVIRFVLAQFQCFIFQLLQITLYIHNFV